MAKTGFESGIKPGRPAKGTNGPMDKGRSSGTSHRPAKLPPTNQGGSSKGK